MFTLFENIANPLEFILNLLTFPAVTSWIRNIPPSNTSLKSLSLLVSVKNIAGAVLDTVKLPVNVETPVITTPLFSARILVEPPVCKSIVSVPNCNLVSVSASWIKSVPIVTVFVIKLPKSLARPEVLILNTSLLPAPWLIAKLVWSVPESPNFQLGVALFPILKPTVGALFPLTKIPWYPVSAWTFNG